MVPAVTFGDELTVSAMGFGAMVLNPVPTSWAWLRCRSRALGGRRGSRRISARCR